MRTPNIQVLHGNCLDVLPILADCSVDSVITDPPYELGFMGKKWDASGIAYNVTLWQECLRVLKPGGHLLAFGGTRTYHRMACAIEDAGFEIRDSIHWLYGSGFPKSLDVSKAIDKADASEEQEKRRLRFTKWVRSTGVTSRQIDEATGTNMGGHYTTAASQPAIMTRKHLEACRHLLGDIPAWVEAECDIRSVESKNFAEREVVGSVTYVNGGGTSYELRQGPRVELEANITVPATEQAKQWEGWGTALKPAHEPIVVARKPLVGTVAGNVLEWGTGALNIDASRIGMSDDDRATINNMGGFGAEGWVNTTSPAYNTNNPENPLVRTQAKAYAAGRWPANVLFSHHEDCDLECVAGCPVQELDRQSGKLTSGANPTRRGADGSRTTFGEFAGQDDANPQRGTDSGGASRFFYCAKPSKRERNAGLDHASEVRHSDRVADDKPGGDNPRNRTNQAKQNYHPTVKPLALMRYLVRLVTPPDGTVLEPFAGSGTTLMACILENFDAIGIEMTDEYLPIIEGRIAWAYEEAAKQTESDQQELPL